MPHPFHALVWGMGASLVLFVAAYIMRKRNAVHMRLAIVAVILNLLSSVYLIYAVRFRRIEMPAHFGLEVVTTHRIFATAMAILMLMMLATGLRRVRDLHIGLHRFFLPGYALTYISGLVIFHG